MSVKGILYFALLLDTVTVFDVAAYILKKLGPISAMKLQKLVYYCQAWSLVWDEKELFEEQIEAWANGPVVRDLYNAHRGKFIVTDEFLEGGDASKLSTSQEETIDAVLEFYGDKTAQWLSDQTHCEDPWKNARGNLSDSERGSVEITAAALHEYYASLKK